MDEVMDEVYDPRLDRIDVSVRLIILMYRSAMWPRLNAIGITRPQHHTLISDALLDISSLRTEDGVLQLLHACPFLLDPAIELQSAYQYRSRSQRLAYYKRIVA